MNLLYTEQELYSMSMDNLQQLIEAAWAMLEAHKSYVHHNGHLMELRAIDDQLTNNWGDLQRVWTNRHLQIKRAWKALHGAVVETKIDQEKAIANAWRSIVWIAKCSDPELNSQILPEMQSYVVDLIWQKSDTPRIHVTAFEHEYWKYTNVKKPNTRKAKVCRKWAQADWTFGLPDFRSK